jgi:tetratricopeptide (TPR) repeat protein
MLKRHARIMTWGFLLTFAGMGIPRLFCLNTPDQEPEVISLLGRKLYAEPATGERLAQLEDELKQAAVALEANPHDPERIILYGRRLAYLWRYNEAIDVYTRGLASFPDNAMFYRHRGHRHISTRRFEQAVADLTRASELNQDDFDIWYHLGLAHYLRGEFESALRAYRSCRRTAQDDDSIIAVSHWLYMTLRRLQREDEASEVLGEIRAGMAVEENQSYHELLLFYKSERSRNEILTLTEASDLDLATLGYGVGNWYLYNGDPEKAATMFKRIVEVAYWPAFGFIAAEVELYRMQKGI